MPTVNVTLPRSFACEAARAIGNAAYDASRRAESLGGDGLGATLAREAMLLRLLHSDILRSLAGCPLFDLDGNPLAPDADCCPVTGQEYGTGA